MDSLTSEPKETIYRHLGNIVDKGAFCSLKEAELIQKPLITGKIVYKLPPVKESKYQIREALVLHLKEVLNPNKGELLTFKVIFLHTAAKLVGNLDIEDGDYLAFCNVKLSSAYAYRCNNSVHNKYIAVGGNSCNPISNVYYKRKNMMEWCQFLTINSGFMETEEIDFENIPDDPVSPDRLPSRSSDEIEIPSTSENAQISVPPNEKDGAVPSTSGYSDVLLHRKKSAEKANDAGPSKTTNIRNAMSELIEVFQEHSTSKINSREKVFTSRNEVFSNSGEYQYVKLKHLRANSRVNVYGIVRRIVKNPTAVNRDKFHLVINIIDETKTDEFLVNIFGHSLEEFPKIVPNNIIRLHRVQVEEYRGGLNARVSHGRDVLVFDKDNTNTTISTARKFTLTESDKKRVEELKEWGLKELTHFRPFTPLHSLELKRKKINLRGKVSYVKVFEDHPNVALRIKDGTKCTVPHERLCLDFDAWAKVITNSKPVSSESEEIDIAIAEADGNFKTLKIGNEIELLDVEVTVQGKFEKTNITNYLKFHMKGSWENLKLLPSTENHQKESQIKSAILQHKPAILSRSKQPLESVKKRQLFDIDKTINFENDGHDSDLDKSTSTDGLKSNCDTDKRKSSDIEEDIPVCSKTFKKNNHIGSVPNSEPQNVIENVVSSIESSPVLQIQNGPKETETYRSSWPQPMSKVPFKIKVNLISTSPDIDENCGEQDILSLIKFYCSSCQEFFSHHAAKWMEIEGDHTAFCIKCKLKGFLREMEDVLTLKVHLLDQHGEVSSAVLLKQNAENFLGYTVADICSSSEIRIKVKDLIRSYFCRVGKKKNILIASVTPAVQGNEIKYHLTGLIPYVAPSV